MATLGKAVANHLSETLSVAGFEKSKPPIGAYTLYSSVRNTTNRYIAFDRMKTGAIRLFLATDVLPAIVPPQVTGPQPIAAEGPWYEMTDRSDTEAAVKSSGKFLVDFGFSWLDNPYRLTPTQWRETANLLIRDLTFVTPVLVLTEERDPKSLVRIRKSLPNFEHKSLLELKNWFAGQTEYGLDRTPLANAIELQGIAAQQNLELQFRDREIAR